MANKLLKDMTYQELMSLAGENSSRWHADVAAREDLQNLNKDIYAEVDRRFGTQSDFATDGSGVWAHSAGNLKHPQYIYDNYQRLYGKADSGSRGVGGYRNQSYNEWKQGGEYQALMDTYRQQADTAMQDVLGQLSARTGGLASSYASAAAAQQYNDIMARLETVARQMYEGDRAAAMDEYEINRAAADTAYDRAVYEREYNDAKTLQQTQEEAAAEEAARARVLEYFTGMGGTSAGADEAMRELIARSGYTDAELAAMEKNYAALMALQRQKSSGSGGGTKVVEDNGSELYDAILEKAQKYDNYDEAIAYLDRMVAAGQINEDEKNIIDTVYLGGSGAGRDEQIIGEAKKMVESGAARNSRTVSEFLNNSDYSEEEKELFKAYMEQWGYDAGYAR
ncbi:MAG: hypothetical protein IKD11_04825 [Oscillospiraceae bacterium]|nr:hypothetical protein [Oscillospiraceae bacterium]